MLTASVFALFWLGLAVLALWRGPIYGVYLYLAVFYIHPPSRWWNQWLPDLRWSLLTAAIVIASILLHRRSLQPGQKSWVKTVPGLVLILYVLWFWLQFPWALDTEAHYTAAVYLAKYLVVFYVLYCVADTPEKATNILMVHVAGCALLGTLCFLAGRTGGGRLDGVGGPGIDDANTLGMFMATGALVAAALVLQLAGWRRIACALAFPTILNGVILTGSRGAFLGLMAGAALLFFFSPPQRRWIFWAGAVVGLALFVRLADTQFINRVLSIHEAITEEGEIDSSAESRLVLLEAQFRMFAGNPLGSGHRGTAALSPQYMDERWLTRTAPNAQAARSSHNTFMTTLVEQGIPGATLYLVLSVWVVSIVLQLKGFVGRKMDLRLTGPPMACVAGLAVVWAAGQFTDYLLAEVQIWFLALLASALEQVRVASAAPAENAAHIGNLPERVSA
jgi:hypothetical protein